MWITCLQPYHRAKFKVKCSKCQLLSRVQLFATTWIVARRGLLSMEFSGKNIGVGSLFQPLLQGIFPNQGLNLGLLHYRQFFSIWDISRFRVNTQLIQNKMLLLKFIFKCYLFFGYSTRHAGSSFPHQGSNLCPLHGKHGDLTTGLPGKSPE